MKRRAEYCALGLPIAVALCTCLPAQKTAAGLVKGQQAEAKKAVSPAQEELKQLQQDVNKATRAYYDKMRKEAAKARKAGKQMPGMRMTPPDMGQYLERCQALAKKYAKTDDAVGFLNFSLRLDRTKEGFLGVMDTFLRDHADNEKVASTVSMLYYRTRFIGKAATADLINSFLDKTKNKTVKAASFFARAQMVLADKAATQDEKDEAVADLEAAIKLAPDSRFGKRAAGTLYEAKHLQVGMKAPDIVGKDTDGVAFKLSDYEGKVVMIDFWGDW